MRDVVIFNEEEVTEEKLENKIKETLKLTDKVAEAHKEYLAYREKFLEIGKREPQVRARPSGSWAACASRVSQAIRSIEFAEPVKRRLVERIRESVERIREAERQDRASWSRSSGSKVSDEYKKVVRKQIHEQREILRAIEEEFDTPHRRAEAHAASRSSRASSRPSRPRRSWWRPTSAWSSPSPRSTRTAACSSWT